MEQCIESNTKIKTFKMFTISIILLAIMDYCLLYVIKIPFGLSKYWSQYDKTLLALIAIFIVIFASQSDTKLLTRNKFLFSYFVILVVSFIILTLISRLYYPLQTLTNTFRQWSGYLLVMLAFPMLKLFIDQHGYNRMFYWLNRIVFIYYVIIIFQRIIYNTSGVFFLTLDENIRNETIRIILGSLGDWMILYNFDNWFCKRNNDKRWFSFVQTVLGLYCLLVVQQTRAFTLTICICMFVIVLMNSTSPKKTLRNILLIIVAFLVLVYSGFLGSFLNTFIENNIEYSGSAIARLSATNYYWRVFFSNPLFGQGIIAHEAYFFIEHGALGIYNYSDVGIIGLLAQIGLFIVPIYIWPLLRWGRISIGIAMKKEYRKEWGFIVAMYAYLLCTTPTLIITNVGRIFLFPFYFAINEYIVYLFNVEITSKLSINSRQRKQND